MNFDRALTTLDNALCANDGLALLRMLCREGFDVPVWVTIWKSITDHAAPEGVDLEGRLNRALTRIPPLLERAAQRVGQPPDPEADQRWIRRIDAVTRTVARGRLLTVGPSQGWPDDPPCAAPGQFKALRRAWMEEALVDHDHATAVLSRWQPRHIQASVQVLVLLLAGSEPLLARLTVHRVRSPGARLSWVPMPASALLDVRGVFEQSMAEARQVVIDALAHRADGDDVALAWDLHVPEGPLLAVEGPSAGAALALAGLWLMRPKCRPHWRTALFRLDAGFMASTAVSAALALAGEPVPSGATRGDRALAAIDGAGEKSRGLEYWSQRRKRLALPALQLHVAQDQTTRRAAGIGLVPHPSLWHLVQALADEADPTTDAQATLLQALLGDDERPAVLDVVLREVAGSRCLNLRHYLLKCWASWASEQGGEVHRRFVPLVVRADARSGFIVDAQQEVAPYPSLDAVLVANDATTKGYVLRGPPGAGKSTLLRQHLQHLAREALRAMETMPSAQYGGQGGEIPVYLALKDLPADEEPVAWVQRHLKRDGAPDVLLSLLLHELVGHAPATWRPRVLLDGLNELPTAPGQTREARGRQVVQALFDKLNRALPPMLLSIREHHVEPLQGLNILRVDVLAWDDDHVRQYLQRRFPQPASDADRAQAGQTRGDEYYRRLQVAPQALEICRRPLHLSHWCELLTAGVDQAPGDRHALFTMWAWQRLRRELGEDPGDLRHFNADAWNGLLTDGDSTVAKLPSTWLERGCARLPQGELFASLRRQALAQWRADADGGRTSADRTAQPIPWPQVVPWLTDGDLRQRWRQATVDLGLAIWDASAGEHGEWRFAHQSVGEYFAACALLPSSPALIDVEWINRTLPHFRRSNLPVEPEWFELDHMFGAEAWEEMPRTVLVKLARQGFDVPAATVAGELYKWNDPAKPGLGDESKTNDLLWSRIVALGKEDLYERTSDPETWRVKFDGFAKHSLFKAMLKWRSSMCATDLTASWWESGVAWNYLFHNLEVLSDSLELRLRNWLIEQGIEERLVDRALRRYEQRHEIPAAPDGAEVLSLALFGLQRTALEEWVAWFILQNLWPALELALPKIIQKLEPGGVWAESQGKGVVHPLVQHLRWILLLESLDAGRNAKDGVIRSGMLQLLTDASKHSDTGPLEQHKQSLIRGAFRGSGVRWRLRVHAGLVLGLLGDNIRYQYVKNQLTDGEYCEGIRPHPSLWVSVGVPERRTLFRIGMYFEFPPPYRRYPAKPTRLVRLDYFEMCKLPVTVGEWDWFYRSKAGKGLIWRREGDPDFKNSLQPVAGVENAGAAAYAEWAAGLYVDIPMLTRKGQSIRLKLPTEVQWEASARGTWPFWLPKFFGAFADFFSIINLLRSKRRFNNVDINWKRTTPVGIHTRDASVLGLLDMRGNVWEWCRKPKDHSHGWREEYGKLWDNLRGGGFNSGAVDFSHRYYLNGVKGPKDPGFRLIRVCKSESSANDPLTGE